MGAGPGHGCNIFHFMCWFWKTDRAQWFVCRISLPFGVGELSDVSIIFKKQFLQTLANSNCCKFFDMVITLHLTVWGLRDMGIAHLMFHCILPVSLWQHYHPHVRPFSSFGSSGSSPLEYRVLDGSSKQSSCGLQVWINKYYRNWNGGWCIDFSDRWPQ